MSAEILDGRIISEEIMTKAANRVETLKAKGITPGLAVILVGDNPASQIYVRNKGIACEKVGIYSKTIKMPADTTEQELEDKIIALNKDSQIHGILVQLPLPEHINEKHILELIEPEKDVDGFHQVNSGKLMNGNPDVIPCTPYGALEMIKRTGVDFSGKEAVVVGRSNIVGKPMAMLLLQNNCTVTICHSKTKNLAEHTKRADILVAAVGKAKMITADMVKNGAIVIDVGINRINGKVVGDVDFDNVKEVASWITPVPGGVGKMTIAMLMMNTVSAAERQQNG